MNALAVVVVGYLVSGDTLAAYRPGGGWDVPRAVADSLPPMSWVLSRTTLKAGEDLDAWLVVSGWSPPTGDSATTVQLVTPSLARMWFRAASETCESSTSATQQISVSSPRDTVLYVCVHPRETGTLRFAAARRADGALGRPQRIAVSDSVTVTSRLSIGATGLAVITAVVGFLTGIFAHILQQIWNRWFAGRQNVKELQAQAVRYLLPDLVENQQRLAAYIQSGVNPPEMVVVGFNSLLSDQGVLAFMKAKEREQYLSALYQLSGQIEDYITTKNTSSDPRRILDAAKTLLRRLQAPLA